MGQLETAVAVTQWLRCHPDVESGASVRATLAFVDVLEGWRRVTGADGGALPVALLTLAHRLRVRPGVDADDLVRQALVAVGLAPEEEDGRADRQDDETPVGAETLRHAVLPTGRLPGEETGDDPHLVFSEDEAAGLLRDLLPLIPAERPSEGPALVLPNRGGRGVEVVGGRPFRPGDRWRDVSVRRTVRRTVWRQEPLSRPDSVQTVLRRPETRYDVVIALDLSGSMGEEGAALVLPACEALTAALLRSGHRVGAVVFAEQALVSRRISPRRQARSFPSYVFTDATNIEIGLDAARLLLRADGLPGTRRRIILVSDAEPTAHCDTDAAWGPAGRPVGWAGVSRLFKGEGVVAARRASLLAAARCRRSGIAMSVLVPAEVSDRDFATALAAVGGGRACVLRRPSQPG